MIFFFKQFEPRFSLEGDCMHTSVMNLGHNLGKLNVFPWYLVARIRTLFELVTGNKAIGSPDHADSKHIL